MSHFERAEDTSLEGADLSGVNLAGADLSGADLRGANLRGARFDGADLTDASLCGANIDRVDFDGCKSDAFDPEWSKRVGAAEAEAVLADREREAMEAALATLQSDYHALMSRKEDAETALEQARAELARLRGILQSPGGAP